MQLQPCLTVDCAHLQECLIAFCEFAGVALVPSQNFLSVSPHVAQPVEKRSPQQNSWQTCLLSPSPSMPSQTAKLRSKVGHSGQTTLRKVVKCNGCPVLGRACVRSVPPSLQISVSRSGVKWHKTQRWKFYFSPSGGRRQCVHLDIHRLVQCLHANWELPT